MSGAVVIVGAGVVGLTTALQLILDGVSPSQITIVAKDGPEKSTSFVAGALWECGMHIVPNITVSQHPLKTNTAAKAMTPTTYRESSDLTSPAMTSWLQTHGTAELGSFRHLQHYDAVVADMGVYLGWLKDQLASHPNDIGHGGSGFCLAWGTAVEASSLVRQCLTLRSKM
ncbi:hypothetical protein DYB31_008337 [Aphanomyces astaci]|uniref:FAD dependent oxidoreductase domain-containing protein n=1 Tax=Aphanomyces astaci TaxID=112090 RepID=A0A397EZM6_APHAT|nr:hypothetical protein DYB31_008337 [Aphanomyces astaci]